MIPDSLGYNGDIMAGPVPVKDAPLFGQRLAALRVSRDWSQENLAERLDTTRANIAYYERKAANPTLDFIQKCADIFGVPVSSLVGEDSAKPKKRGPSSKLELQLDEVKKLPKGKQKFVSEFLDTVLRSAKTS